MYQLQSNIQHRNWHPWSFMQYLIQCGNQLNQLAMLNYYLWLTIQLSVFSLRKNPMLRMSFPVYSVKKKTLVLNEMKNHVGSHILHFLHDVEDQINCELQSIGENTCGFCAKIAVLPSWKQKKKSGLSIVSNSSYHYAGINYKAAAQVSKCSPCTHISSHCSACPPVISGDPQTIGKYNAVYHLIPMPTYPLQFQDNYCKYLYVKREKKLWASKRCSLILG